MTRTQRTALVSGAAALGAIVAAAVAGPVVALILLALAAGAAGALAVTVRRQPALLQIDEIERLRRAELALAAAPSTEAAARELAGHAMALLGADAAVVIIEGVGDTVRVAVGDVAGAAVYEPGSRMRLLADDGVPCGSIAVSARADGRGYEARDESILDALAERVSSTLHRLSLFEAVRAEQRTLADVLVSSSDGIVAVGPDLQIRSWNPAMARITGVPVGTAVGRHCCAVFKPHDEHGASRFGANCPGRTGKEVVDLLVQVEVGGGDARWLNCAFSPLSDGGYVLVARDVTARKQIEDEKADFLATVSHELRTPLTPIKGFLQTLLRRDEEFTPEDRRHVYEVMLREEGRLERLVHQLLQATSLEHDRSFVPETIDWPALVADQLEKFRRDDPARGFDLEVRDDVTTVLGDTHLAQEVLGNLLSNAGKYSPDGAPVKVVVEREGVSVVTTVIDRGPGVATADRDRIFDKFTRLGDHLTRAQQGVGLGLYIARRSVESMGGRIWVVPGPGGGAAFSFTVPAARTRVRTPATPGSRLTRS
jgi:PAS domain S-box-containing protein